MSSVPMNTNYNAGKYGYDCRCGSRKPQHSHSQCCTQNRPQNTGTITFRHTGEIRVWRPDTSCDQCRYSDHQHCHHKHHSCGCNFGY